MNSEKDTLSYLFVCDGKGFGGLELQMVERTLDAIARGDNAVVACSPNSKLWEYAQGLGAPLTPISYTVPYLDPWSIYKLAHVMKRYAVDICIAGQSHLLSQVLLARKVSGIQAAVVFWQQMQSGHSKRDWFHDRIYSSLDLAIVSTQRMKEELGRTTIMPPERILKIPYGIHTDNFVFSPEEKLKAREYFDIPRDSYVVGCIGRIDRQKDQTLLAEAFAQAVLPTNSVLVIAGDASGDKTYNEELHKLVNELSISDRTRFLPFTKEVPKLLSCFDVFVLPSRSETFGLVVIEAMAAGLPVVATDSGGVPEIIDDKVTGLLFAPGSKDTLATYLTDLANSAELRLRLSEPARRSVRERYEHGRQTSQFFDACRYAYNSRHNR